MQYRISLIIIFLCINFFHLSAQEDTSKYQKKYAFAPKDPTKEYEKGQEFFLADGVYKVWNGSSFGWGFYNESTKQKLTEPKYDSIGYRYLHKKNKGFYTIIENKKYGLLWGDRSTWVSPQYDQLNYISTSYQHYISIKSGSKFGVLNPDGQLVLDAEYDDILFDGFRYKVLKNNKWGLRDNQGKELIPTCFDKIDDHEFVAMTRLQLGDKWTIFNWIKDNPCACEKKYDGIDYFSKYFVVRKETKFALLNVDGKEILPMEYDFMSPFFLKFLNSILVGKDKKVGVLRVDSLEKVHTEVPIEYSDVWVEEHTFKIKVRLNDKIDYYFNDQTLFDLAYNDVQYYEEINRVMVKKGTKWGMMSVEGEEIIPIQYSKIHVMNPNQFMVQKGTKWGVINGVGKEMIAPIYDEFDYRPEKQFFFVKKSGKWGIVSLTKGVILPPEYDDMYTLPNKTYLVMKKGLWGIVAAGGRVLVPLEYSSYDYKFQDREVKLKHPDGSVKKYPVI